MAILPYTSVSISGYNSSPPPDDGSQTSANKVEWAKHKTKIGDPLKTLAEAINTNVLAAFATLALEDWTLVTTTATIAESDFHNGYLLTSTGRQILPAPSSLEDGWHMSFFNAATGLIQLQATATDAWRNHIGQTASEVVIAPGRGVRVYNTATTWLHQGWSPGMDDSEVAITAQMFT